MTNFFLFLHIINVFYSTDLTHKATKNITIASEYKRFKQNVNTTIQTEDDFADSFNSLYVVVFNWSWENV